MPLHPFFAEKLAPLSEVTAETAFLPGVLDDFISSAPGWEVPQDVEITERTADGPHGPVGMRIYRSTSEHAARPGVLWMHGGGFAAGTLDWAEAHAVAAELAHRTGAVVVSVDYRLAVGDVTFPVPLDDVMAAWSWLEEHAADLGVTTGLFIGGGSAGANLAAAASMRLRDEGRETPRGMLLAYGVYHFPVPGLSPEHNAQLADLPPFLRMSPEGHVAAFRNYVGTVAHVPAHAAPGNGNLHGMPPAFVVVSEYDDLRASSDTFVAQLQDAGVAVRTYLAEGALHGHLNWFPAAEISEVDATIEFFVQCLQAPPST